MREPVLIAFGANIDPLNNLFQGLTHLHRLVKLEAVSTVWRTDPLPDPKQTEAYDLGDRYLNGAVLTWCQIPPLELRLALKKIEADCHRVRSPNRFAPRSLDLDIALIGGQVLNHPELTLPDPDIVHRSFLALPLAELMPELIHPSEKKSLAQLAAGFPSGPMEMERDDLATKLLRTLINRQN
ncbi:MAG: 2-amino-4-hydroxy-6-hydroxymethyldihydropteridine diphosphokinase [Magnetococcales bacterium]|nr:2-amino-4-hydroxy-6-hydroxymethyldihydropteridine diphosphokinase [Magnetococcales bacterium]